MSLFVSRLPINNKRPNARRDGKELRSAQGSINVPSTSDFSESEFAESYKHGHAGGRTGHHSAPKQVVSADFSDFQESTLSDKTDMTIKVTPAMRPLYRRLGNHVEGAVSGGFTVQQVRELRKLFNNPSAQGKAEALERLENKETALTAAERVTMMNAHREMQVIQSAITRICRAS